MGANSGSKESIQREIESTQREIERIKDTIARKKAEMADLRSRGMLNRAGGVNADGLKRVIESEKEKLKSAQDELKRLRERKKSAK